MKCGDIKMYCRFCGKTIPSDSSFCRFCGRQLAEDCNEQIFFVENNNCKVKSNFFVQNSATIFKTIYYSALIIFLFFNLKMAPFWGIGKFVAYVIEGALAIYLVNMAKKKVIVSSSVLFKALSLFFSFLIIIASISLRIIYENKVYSAEKNIPDSGEIIVQVEEDTDYYSDFLTGLVSDVRTTIKLDGVSGTTRISLNKPILLEVTCEGNSYEASSKDTISIGRSDFKNGKYTITKTYELSPLLLSATVKINIKRTCTFWDVIFY